MEDMTIEETQEMYSTPFLIWANYDIEEKYIEKISLNYLCALLMQESGNIELSSYQNYLLDLYNKYPVINANDVIDSEGNYYTKNEALELKEIKEYYNVMYNHVVDKKNRVDSFFGISQ